MRTLLLLLSLSAVIHTNLAQSSALQLQQVIDAYEQEAAKPNDNPWPKLDPKTREQRIQQLQGWSHQLSTLISDSLDVTEHINLDMLRLIVDDELFQLRHKAYSFPLNAEGGFLAGIVYSIRGTRITDEEGLDKYLDRLAALPIYFKARIADMRHGMAIGKVSPKLIVKNCIDLIDQVLETPIDELFYVQVASNTPHKEAIITAVEKHVLPAYQQLRNFLVRQYMPAAPAAIGVSTMTDGKLFYEQRVRFFTTFDITPQEIFDQGMAEVERIRAEMEAIITELGYKGSFADFFTFLRTDPQFYCTKPQDLLDRAAWITTKAQGQLPRFFGKLPRMPLDVTPVPDALAPNYTTGRYSQGSYENGRSGQYWVNTYNLPSRPLYVLPSLTLHEGVPGHHLQIMLAAELEDSPRFRANTYLSAFGEGWGLYAEHLGQEMGIYTTLYEQFGRLTYEMWRACRLVVDPGMHYFGWSRQEAVDFMANNTALSLHEVNTEINRYIGWPGQAVSYKMGELKIKALRAEAEAALGNRFDIRAFHDVLLSNGSIPLASLERVVRAYIRTVDR